MYEVLHAGFDTLDFALQGALPRDTLDTLVKAKERAVKEQTAQLVEIGPERVPAHVGIGGARGGFAVTLDTGPLGERILIKDNSDGQQWNGFVTASARALLALGYEGYRNACLARLAAMGFVLRSVSINRVDFAIDIRTKGFEPSLHGFVAPVRTKAKPHWGKREHAPDPYGGFSAVLTGRRLESITVGRMPGAQVILYDKVLEATQKQARHWFKAWGIDRETDSSLEVWRVELRAGANELKGKYQLRSFADFEGMIGDVYRNLASRIRYVYEGQTDTNVTRQRLHPLWETVRATIGRDLLSFQSGVLPSDIIEIEREVAIERHRKLVLGNLASLAVAKGMSDEAIEADLAEQAKQLTVWAVNDVDDRFWRSVRRARERLMITLVGSKMVV